MASAQFVPIEAESYLSGFQKRFMQGVEIYVSNAQFKFIGKLDTALIIFSYILALIAGLVPPLMILVFSYIVEIYIEFIVRKKIVENSAQDINKIVAMKWLDFDLITDPINNLHDHILYHGVETLLLATIYFITNTFYVINLNRSTYKIVKNARKLYFEAVLRLELSWFDVHNANKLAHCIIDEPTAIEQGLGEKLGVLLKNISTILSALVISIYFGPGLSSVLLLIFPCFFITKWVQKKLCARCGINADFNYFLAEQRLRQTFMNFQQVKIYGGEKIEFDRYSETLRLSERAHAYGGIFRGLIKGILMLCVYAIYSICFYSSVNLTIHQTRQEHFDVQNLLIIFFSMQIAIIKFANLGKYLGLYFRGKFAADKILTTIRSKPLIVAETSTGLTLRSKAFISFENVSFAYPSQPVNRVLNGCSFQINAREHVIFAGDVRCGKTTILRLIQRFYEPQYGKIILENKRLKYLSTRWLRSNIGYCNDNPVFSHSTFYDIITYGARNKNYDDIIEVAKVVGIYDEIMKMPRRFDTLISEEFSLVFKQKLAIARIIFRKPLILILDNATSALSREDEGNLYTNLIRLRLKSLITVTARVSLMKRADIIFLIAKGALVEFGTFDELQNGHGTFAKIINPILEDLQEDDPHDLILDCMSKVLHHLGAQKNVDPASPPLYKEIELNKVFFCSDFTHSKKRNIFQQNSALLLKYYQRNILIENKQFTSKIKKGTYRRNFSRMIALSLREWPYLVIAGVAAFLIGLSFSAYAILFGECLGIIATDNIEHAQNVRGVFYSKLFLLAGVIVGISILIKECMISFAGADLISKLRRLAFKAMLDHNLQWFDNADRNVCTLLNILRNDTQNAQNIAGVRLIEFIEMFSMLFSTIVLGCYYNMTFGLLILFALPILMVGLYLQQELSFRQSMIQNQTLYRAKLIAEETFSRIFMIFASGLEMQRVEVYNKEINIAYKRLTKNNIFRSILYGLCTSFPYYIYAIIIYYGGILLRDNEIDFSNLFKIIEAAILGTIFINNVIGKSYSFKSVRDHFSCTRLLALLDEPAAPTKILLAQNGDIQYRKVQFKALNNELLPYLQNLDIKINEGQIVAFVGKVGSGVEAPIPLLLRMYQPSSGRMTMNKYFIGDFNEKSYYSKFAIANRDSIFFGRTIIENIAYGRINEYVTMDQVVSAAKEARFHDFVTTLHDGYNTVVRSDPYNLPASARIRLSLARALIRDPTILIIDRIQSCETEDTEEILRDAIKHACIGRTCIISTNDFLSASQIADQIYFMNDNKVFEEGTHKTLLEKRTLYYRMHKRQSEDIEYKERLLFEANLAFLAQAQEEDFHKEKNE